MKRENGFIDICDMLNIPRYNYLNRPADFVRLVDILKTKKDVKIINSHIGTKLCFSFVYNDETYFFNFDSRAEVHSALFAEEIAKCLNIPVVSYDLAALGNIFGLISKDFKRKDAKYITGFELFNKTFNRDEIEYNRNLSVLLNSETDNDKLYEYLNTLETIWIALERRYAKDADNEKIVASLMEKIVDMFILDIITGQTDRHSENWMLVEYDDGKVDFQPLYDNVRAFFTAPFFAQLGLIISHTDNNVFESFLERNLSAFISQSSQEFSSRIENSLWVYRDENIDSMIESIERKIDNPLDDMTKWKYRQKLNMYREYFMEELKLRELPKKSSI